MHLWKKKEISLQRKSNKLQMRLDTEDLVILCLWTRIVIVGLQEVEPQAVQEGPLQAKEHHEKTQREGPVITIYAAVNGAQQHGEDIKP
nr:hypothetical protein [Bacillus rubiinfantis]